MLSTPACSAKDRSVVESTLKKRTPLNDCCMRPVSNDSIAKLARLPYETRRLSEGHGEGVKAVRHRDDTVDAT